MKKRIISVLLLCCMVLGLLPMTTFANNGGAKAIQLGTSGISGYDSTNSSYDYIHFGTWNNSTVKWRVLDTKTNMANAQEGDGFFLLSDVLLGTGSNGDVYFDNTSPYSYSNAWQDSTAKTWCNNFYSGIFSDGERGAVLATTKSDGAFTSSIFPVTFAASENILNGDKVFFLSAEEAENAAYGFDDNALANYGGSAGVWWLRSPYAYDTRCAGIVTSTGYVNFDYANEDCAARPALNLDLKSVLFISAAVGGKSADGIFKIPEYSGNEWKLTLLDDNREFAITEQTANGKPGDTIMLNYTGAATGTNEYISVIIADNSGAQYYGRVAQPTGASGQIQIEIPASLADGTYTLNVFSEQCNGDYKTDYASRFQTVELTVEEAATEQFAFTPGGTYYFDLSDGNIPGTVNDNLPDKSMHYVPFTYAGTVGAYKLTSEMATTEEYARQNEYAHSLFVADYAVTYQVIWNTLNDAGLIFGKNYTTGGVSYTLRAPSTGSTGWGEGCSTPQNNEWDRILDKNDEYIKNWSKKSSWGQDTSSSSATNRVYRGHNSARSWGSGNAVTPFAFIGFRPVLEVLNPDMLGSDGLKAVTLDLGGGKLGGSSEDIQIIVKNGSAFTAPASDGLTRPDGNSGSYFMWLGSDGELYAPGDNVPADVTRLTAQFALIEQFKLAPGGIYYFDLSGANIPGTVNSNLPDKTMHYVPFTYVGIVDAYRLKSAMATTEGYAQKNGYAHSLFVADYAVTHTTSWKELYAKDLIFDKSYAAGGVDYTLRMPSMGSGDTGSGNSKRGTPQSNEWDRILDKNDGYIKNWSGMSSWGQDTSNIANGNRALRGHESARSWGSSDTAMSGKDIGFRPVLEVLNFGTLDSYGLKAVTLDLGGGKLGGSFEDIQIIVKNGESFTAPASDGLTRPDGDTGSSFMWLGSDGKLYAPGDIVSADVTRLTAQFAPSSHSVTITTDSLPDGKVDETYSQNLTADGTAPITWNISGGNLPDGLKLDENTGEISGTPTVEGTATFTVKAKNITGSDTKELSITIAGVTPTDPAKPGISVTGTYTYDGSEHTAAVTGYDSSTMDISGNVGTDAGDYTVSVMSKTGKWVDGSTEAVTASWSIGKATQEAPNGLTGVAPTTKGGSDGRITGVTDKMEYRMVGEGSYTACGGTEIENLPAGNYFVRYAEDNNHFAGTDAEVTVGEGAPLADCTITFEGNGGSGSMEPVTVKEGANYVLPACGFSAPADQEFKAWEIGGTEYKVGDSYTVNRDTEIKALWENSVIPPTTYTITVITDGNGSGTASPSAAVFGTEITLTATPNTGYQFKEWEVISGGVTITNNKFTMPDSNVEVKAIFEEDAPPAPTEYTVIVTSGGNGMASASHAKAVFGTEITLTATPDTGYQFKEWEVISGGVTITNNKFTMPDSNVEVKAIFAMISQQTTPDPVNENTGTPSLPDNSNTAPAAYTDSGTNNGNSTAPASSPSPTPDTEPDPGIKPDAENTRHTTPKDNGILKEWQDARDNAATITGDQPAADEEAEEENTPFTDVSEDDWFYDDVMFVYENGLMEGISKTQFGPYETEIRGMMAEILWRMEGRPAPKVKNKFTDVEEGARYADAVAWITENNILNGYSEDSFGPEDPITYEQLAVMFYRYAEYKGYDVSIKGNPDSLKGTDGMTDEAGKAMLWAVSNGLIQKESSGLSAPQDPVPRAEIAAMIHRFIEKYKLVQNMTPNGQMGWIAPEEMNPSQTDSSRVPGWIGISLCAALAGGFVLFMLWMRRRRRVM